MRVTKFPTVSTTTNTTYNTDPVNIEIGPFQDRITFQVTQTTTGTVNNTVQLQIRPYPDLNWVSVGSTENLNTTGAGTTSIIFSRQFPCSEYRLRIVRSSATGGTATVDAWVGR